MRNKEIDIVHLYQNKSLIDLTGEEWKDIPGLEGYAMISNFGRIKRLAYELIDISGRSFFLKEQIQT